jgi:hypothetical protein
MWGLACFIIIFELDGMNIIGIGSNVFALPQFNMLKSIIQQFFRLVLAKENPSQWNINPKFCGLIYKCTQSILIHNKKH